VRLLTGRSKRFYEIRSARDVEGRDPVDPRDPNT